MPRHHLALDVIRVHQFFSVAVAPRPAATAALAILAPIAAAAIGSCWLQTGGFCKGNCNTHCAAIAVVSVAIAIRSADGQWVQD